MSPQTQRNWRQHQPPNRLQTQRNWMEQHSSEPLLAPHRTPMRLACEMWETDRPVAASSTGRPTDISWLERPPRSRHGPGMAGSAPTEGRRRRRKRKWRKGGGGTEKSRANGERTIPKRCIPVTEGRTMAVNPGGLQAAHPTLRQSILSRPGTAGVRSGVSDPSAKV